MPHVRSAARALIVRDGHVLVIRNRDAEGDWFILPGGGQNHGEDLRATLVRECREEVGAEVRVGRLRFVREIVAANHGGAGMLPEGFHQVEHIFDCTLLGEASCEAGHEPDESQCGIEWTPPAELIERRFYPSALARRLVGELTDGDPVYLGDTFD